MLDNRMDVGETLRGRLEALINAAEHFNSLVDAVKEHLPTDVTLSVSMAYSYDDSAKIGSINLYTDAEALMNINPEFKETEE